MIYEQVPGWVTGEKIFDEAIEMYDNCFFIEIGTFHGKSAFYMAEKIKQLGKHIRIFCVDPYFYGMYGEHKPIEGMDWRTALNDFVEGIYKYEFQDILFPIVNASERVLPVIDSLIPLKGQIKMVYIDGNHSDKYVREDIQNARKLVESGIICGHDYEEKEWGDVVRAVDELLGKPFKIVGDKDGRPGDTWVHYVKDWKIISNTKES